jgi:hypothetical protein
MQQIEGLINLRRETREEALRHWGKTAGGPSKE